MIKVIFSVGGQQVVFIYNKNTPTTQAKTCMKSGRFLGGGRRSDFMSTLQNRQNEHFFYREFRFLGSFINFWS